MALNAAIPVRFEQSMADRLKTVSTNTNIPVAQLIRIAAEKYLTEVESTRSVTIAMRDEAPKSRKTPTK